MDPTSTTSSQLPASSKGPTAVIGAPNVINSDSLNKISEASQGDKIIKLEQKRITEIVACFLDRIYVDRIQSNKVAKGYESFFATVIPKYSIGTYFQRLVMLYRLGVDTIMLAACKMYNLYMQYNNEQLPIVTPYSIYRFVLASLVVSMKFCVDECLDNEDAAKIGGITLEELNKLEVEFLFIIKFDLYIAGNEYISTYDFITQPQLHIGCVHPPMYLPYGQLCINNTSQ